MTEEREDAFDLQGLCALLDQLGFEYQRSQQGMPMVSLLFQLEPCTLHCLAIWDEQTRIVEFHFVLPFVVPLQAQASVVESLVRANAWMRPGRLDFDHLNSRVVLKSSHVVADRGMSQAQLLHHLQAALFLLNTLFLPLQEVALRGASVLGPAQLLQALSPGAPAPVGGATGEE